MYRIDQWRKSKPSIGKIRAIEIQIISIIVGAIPFCTDSLLTRRLVPFYSNRLKSELVSRVSFHRFSFLSIAAAMHAESWTFPFIYQ